MPRTILFTGAGASKPFGFPLTGEFFPMIRKDLRKNQAFTGIPPRSKNQELEEMLTALLPGFPTAERLPLITDVLSLIDYSLQQSLAPLPGRNIVDLMRFRALLEEAIFHALWWPYDPHEPPALLEQLATWMSRQSRGKGNELVVISTNYDIAIDDLLFDHYNYKDEVIARDIDFGMMWRTPSGRLHPRPASPSLRLFKLHGSLNWLRCDLCEHIYVNVHGPIASQAFRTQVTDANTCECGQARLRAVLIAPSLVRDIRDANLLEIWKSSLESLRRADEWIIAGYSFPPEDLAIRSMFLRAYQGRAGMRPPRIRVIQPMSDPEMEARYRLLFPTCEFEPGGMEAFIEGL